MAQDTDQESFVNLGTDINVTPWGFQEVVEANLRWLAEHPWIKVVKVSDLFRQGWQVIDHGDLGLPADTLLPRFPLEGDAHYNAYFSQYYYGGIADGHSPFAAKGQRIESYADYIPYWRDGLPIPSGRKMGDDRTAGTIIYETLKNLRAAPDNDLTTMAWLSYFNAIGEQTLHTDRDYKPHDPDLGRAATGGPYLHFAAKQRANILRQVNKIVAGARWAEEAAQGTLPDSAALLTLDLDLDGEDEYVLRNNQLFAIFENDGGTLEYTFAYDPSVGSVQLVGPTYQLILSSLRNYEEGESPIPFPPEETAFEDGEAYRYAVFDITLGDQSVGFASPDGQIRKTFTLEGNTISAHYETGKLSELYVYFTLPVNPASMSSRGWWEKLTRVDSKEAVGWQNADGGYAAVNPLDTELIEAPSFLDSPARDEGRERQDQPYPRGHWLFFPYHTVFVRGVGEFDIGLTLAAVPPSAPVTAPAATPGPTASYEVTPAGPTGPSGPLPLAILADFLLLLGVGAMVARRWWRKRA